MRVIFGRGGGTGLVRRSSSFGGVSHRYHCSGAAPDYSLSTQPLEDSSIKFNYCTVSVLVLRQVINGAQSSCTQAGRDWRRAGPAPRSVSGGDRRILG